MAVLQISLQLEQKPGVLSKISELLGREGINIGAISIADSVDIAALRFMCDDPNKALQILKNAGYNDAALREVIAVETPDHPGGLNAVLKPLAVKNINVFYLYPYMRKIRDNAILIFRVDDVPKAEQVLAENWIHLLGDEIYSI